MERLVFQTMPTVILGGRTLQDVPVILQYEDTPLVEIITQSSLVYTTRIPIYAPDGAKLAKVIGTTIYPTEEGSAKGIELNLPRIGGHRVKQRVEQRGRNK